MCVLVCVYVRCVRCVAADTFNNMIIIITILIYMCAHMWICGGMDRRRTVRKRTSICITQILHTFSHQFFAACYVFSCMAVPSFSPANFPSLICQRKLWLITQRIIKHHQILSTIKCGKCDTEESLVFFVAYARHYHIARSCLNYSENIMLMVILLAFVFSLPQQALILWQRILYVL